MALDREATLKKAEKLLRQGRIDQAIAEYVRLVDDDPADWNTANTLGDLYARAGLIGEAVAQYSRIAGHLMEQGFYPKAAALCKKVLKIQKDDEATQLRLAELSALQGLLADAKAHYHAIAARRRNRSDRRGEAEIVVRLGDVDPADIDARLAAARTLEALGDSAAAAARYKSLYADLLEKGREREALDALREAARLRPDDPEARSTLARAALEAGDVESARGFLDRKTAGSDRALLVALLERHVAAGEGAEARTLAGDILSADYELRSRLLETAWAAAGGRAEAVFPCAEAIVEAAIGRSDFRSAASALQQFASHAPGHVAALLKLVEVCVDGGFESEMYAAQEQLADAYLGAAQAAEARVIAEDLVAREPWEEKHIARFRRALVMLKVPDPDNEIAERLSGDAPFMARDPFIVLPDQPALPPLAEAASAAARDQGAIGSSDAAPAEGPPDRPARPAEIDLTGALARAPTGPAAPPPAEAGSLDTVFDGMRARAQAGTDYSAQHMTLARTYLEMSMEAEAATALEVAAKSPRLRFEAASLLGRLHRRRGDLARALEWLERAAEAPAPSEDEGRALQYDFGVALDESGETARALAVFLELQAEAGDYRDTPARIERLARVQTGG